MHTLDFNLLASGRMTADEAKALSATTLSGDPGAAVWALENTAVLY